ncbi:MAG: oligosaccharide flippase family protein [Chloroflexi bacterium]|nr:oligosaccharide flippase family protein [Chloroflexota bacterium]
MDRRPGALHIRGSALLLGGRLFALALGLVTEVVLVRSLSKEDFGAFAWALSIVSLGASLAAFGFDKAVGRFVAIYQERQTDRVGGVIVLMAMTIVLIGGFIVIGGFILHGAMRQSGWVDEAAAGLLLIVIGLVPLRALDALLISLLAMFASPMSILVRRYLLAPGLEFAVVAVAAVVGAGVATIAVGYVIAALIGLVVAGAVLARAFARSGILHSMPRRADLPVREVFAYAIPLLSSDFVFVLRGSLMVIMLEALHSTAEVATFRAVLPVARTNLIVLQTFAVLFTPAAARFFARGRHSDLNALYWQSAGWIAVATLPVLLLSFSLAGPVTVLLFGESYADAGAVLAVLAVGYYFNAAMGFNSLTLRIVGVVRYIFLADLVTIVVILPIGYLLISSFGALGAAISLSTTLVLQNVIYHAALHRKAGVDLLPRVHLRTYVIVTIAAGCLFVIQLFLRPPIAAGLLAAALTAGTVLYVSRKALNVPEIFPELMRVPGLRWLLRP